MNMINVMGSQNGIVLYNGEVVTCYPGSNQTDKGKLQLEFNMARFVTRLSSKNFCVTNPSFVITTRQSTVTGIEQLVVSSGQASINGMDLIITDSIAVNPPESTGEYYLVLRLQRSDDDGNGNVLGDLTVGVQTIFQGVCLAYYDEKPDPIDPDFLYLAKVTWDGSEFTSIVEDEDKYGRIWAEDILCKIDDPKHPDIRRLLLQDFIYNIPDWYVSKEGDVEFGAIEWLPGRQGGDYTSEDYGTGKYGIQIQAVSDNKTIVNKKASSVSESNPELVVKEEFTNTQLKWSLGKLEASINSALGYDFNINTPYDIRLSSAGVLYSTANLFYISGGHINQQLSGHELEVTDGIYSTLSEKTEFLSNTELRKIIGKARIQYKSSDTSLKIFKTDTASTPNNVLTDLVIEPDVNITNDLTVGHNVTVTGELTASKVWNAVYNDICEFMEKEDYDEVIEPGDVVYFNDSGKVSKYHEGVNSTAIAGVVSSEDTWGYALGGEGLDDNQKVPVALKGRVWVKTDNIDFKPGDFVSVDSCGCVYKGDPHIYDIFVLGIATKKEENGKVWMMIK